MRVPSTQVQNNFGKYLKYVEANEEIIVTKQGKDIARILPVYDKAVDHVMESAEEYKSTGGVTYEQFLELTEASEQRFELIDGIIYNLASPSFRHQHAVHEIHGAFYNWFKGKSCTPLTSPFDITFLKDENNVSVVQPDIVVICDQENRDDRDRYKGIPTLVVEVLSPSTRSKDLTKKLDLYMQSGVKEYWIVDPNNEQISIYQLADQDIVNNITYFKHKDKGEGHEARSFYFDGLQVYLQDIFA